MVQIGLEQKDAKGTKGSAFSPIFLSRISALFPRACLKTTRGAAARDFGCGQGGEAGASPQRAACRAVVLPCGRRLVRAEPTQAADTRPAARRVFAEKAVWLRCSSVEDPPGIFSFVAPRHPAFSAKTAPLVISKQALIEAFPRWIYRDLRWLGR